MVPLGLGRGLGLVKGLGQHGVERTGRYFTQSRNCDTARGKVGVDELEGKSVGLGTRECNEDV